MTQQYPQQPPKKHTVRNIAIGVMLGGLLLIGGCTALLGASSSEPTGFKTVDTGPSPEPVVTPTNTPAVEPTTEPTPAPKTTPSPKVTHKPAPATTKPAAPALTMSQEQAVGTAEDYLGYQSFSRKGLIDQLKFEGFSAKDATFAVDYLKVDWNDQAAKKAKEYLSMQHFSRIGLIEQLEFEGFTARQASYGVTKAGL